MSRMARPTASNGFTLIETVATMLLLGLVAVTLNTLNAQLFSGRSHLLELELSTPLLQACAERILAIRRLDGLTEKPSFDTACDAIAGADTFDVRVTPSSGSASTPRNASTS